MLKFVDSPPAAPEILRTLEDGDIAERLTSDDVEHIAEIFQTPLAGAYNWDYEEADRRITKLYRLGKERNWNGDHDLDWSKTFPLTESPQAAGTENPFEGWDEYDALDEAQRHDFGWHQHAWTLCQFLHGEQGALLVSSQLVSCAPTYDAKLYASSQTFDEARHVEVFGRYVRSCLPVEYPINPHLKALLDKVLTDPRWDLKFIGMQLVIESLALAAFGVQKEMAADPLLKQLLEYVIRDEARHVAFGVTYMEQFVKELSPEEREERADFAFEACRVMRERIVPTDVFVHWKMDPEEGRRRFLAAGQLDTFRNLLFMRIMPNLNKVGLLTDAIKPKYEELGLMEFAGLPHDGEIDWAELSAPLAPMAATEVTAAE